MEYGSSFSEKFPTRFKHVLQFEYIYMPSIEKEPIYDVYCISRRQYQRFLNILFWGCLSGAVGSVGARRCCRGRGFESRLRQNIYSINRLSLFTISLRVYINTVTPFYFQRSNAKLKALKNVF